MVRGFSLNIFLKKLSYDHRTPPMRFFLSSAILASQPASSSPTSQGKKIKLSNERRHDVVFSPFSFVRFLFLFLLPFFLIRTNIAQLSRLFHFLKRDFEPPGRNEVEEPPFCAPVALKKAYLGGHKTQSDMRRL